MIIDFDSKKLHVNNVMRLLLADASLVINAKSNFWVELGLLLKKFYISDLYCPR